MTTVRYIFTIAMSLTLSNYSLLIYCSVITVIDSVTIQYNIGLLWLDTTQAQQLRLLAKPTTNIHLYVGIVVASGVYCSCWDTSGAP